MTTQEIEMKMSRYPILTVEMLKTFKPCAAQMRRFKKLFPNGALITPRNGAKAGEELSMAWAARMLLTEKAFAYYEKLMLKPSAEFGRATAIWMKAPWELGPARDKARRAHEAARLKQRRARGRAFAMAAMKDKA